MASVGLYMIVKDEFVSMCGIIDAASPYFDEIILTVSDKKTYQKLKKEYTPSTKYKPLNIQHRPWNDRFDDARNHNFAQGDTDYKFWLDADDEFDFSVIPKLVELAEEGQYDTIWLPYEYAHDEHGNCIVLHWRERLINAHKPFEWRGWVHENCICDEPFTSKRVDIPVIHRSDHKEESEVRNHKILEKAFEETKDPRYVHYLGISLFGQKRWRESIDVLKQYIEVGGWDEEIYRSLLRMSEAANQLDATDEAQQYVLQAIALLPDYPQAYFQIAQLEFEQDNHKQCLEWLKVAFSKKQPESSSIVDPTMQDRAKLMGAMCEFQLKNHREAAELLNTVQTVDITEIKPEFEHQASIDRVASVLPALIKHYEVPSELWHLLKPELKYDNRFRKLRELVTLPRKWEDKTIAIFCGKGYEEWGPYTLDKGMGGSEEAIVYLSRELRKQGFHVVVYGECKEHNDFVDLSEGRLAAVRWKPWTHVDKRDHFDTLIVWRYPQMATQFNANKIFVDMHDLLPQKMVRPLKDVTYLFKSQFHKDQYPQITDYKIIGNGIKESQFNEIV